MYTCTIYVTQVDFVHYAQQYFQSEIKISEFYQSLVHAFHTVSYLRLSIYNDLKIYIRIKIPGGEDLPWDGMLIPVFV